MSTTSIMASATQTCILLRETSHKCTQWVSAIRRRQWYTTRAATSRSNRNYVSKHELGQVCRRWHTSSASPATINTCTTSLDDNIKKHGCRQQQRLWYTTVATPATIDKTINYHKSRQQQRRWYTTGAATTNVDPNSPKSDVATNDCGTETERQKDVFIDGSVKDKRTLRGEQELKGQAPDADPSEASTVAVRIRKQLQAQSKQRSGGQDVKDQEPESPKRKPTDLRHQTKDLSRLDGSVVAKILRDRVIYDEGDIVAIDKPYGLPVHGGPGMGHSITSLLPQLSRRLSRRPGETGPPELHLIHRLDKETTGVMLLARTEMTARILHEMFRKRLMSKRYLVITVGIPSPLEGIIDMPMAEAEIAGKHRMVVKTDVGDLLPNSWAAKKGQGRRRRSDQDAQQAVTKYKVLSKGIDCALVELEPETGVKHQIRVHLAQGLGCPILGDHKYSHHNKLAPQKLPGSMLQALGITQPKARTVPMHLHARQLVIPETFNQQNIFISTRVPWHFSHNMKKLKLKYDP